MKVKELITLLQRQNPELDVATTYGEIENVIAEYVEVLGKEMVFITTKKYFRA